MRQNKLWIKSLIFALLVLIVDQASKFWILLGLELPLKGSINLLPFLNFTMVWNKGISMGMLTADSEMGRWLLVAGTSVIMIFILLWLKKSERRLESLALGAVLGGALGNVIDRIIHGAVVDFVHVFAFDYHFYVFNVADAAISLGVAALILDTFLFERLQGQGKSSTTAEEK